MLAARPAAQVIVTHHGRRSGHPDPRALFDATTETPGHAARPGEPAAVPHRGRHRRGRPARGRELDLLRARCTTGRRSSGSWASASTSWRRSPGCAASVRGAPPARRGRRLADRLFPHAPAVVTPMARHRAPGAGIALIADGELVSAWGEGVTGGEDSAPVGPETVFQACSVSKHVTALGVMRLVQEGRLDLDLDIGRYLTSWRPPERGDHAAAGAQPHGRAQRVPPPRLPARRPGAGAAPGAGRHAARQHAADPRRAPARLGVPVLLRQLLGVEQVVVDVTGPAVRRGDAVAGARPARHGPQRLRAGPARRAAWPGRARPPVRTARRTTAAGGSSPSWPPAGCGPLQATWPGSRWRSTAPRPARAGCS